MPADPTKDFNTVLSKHGYSAIKKIGEGSFGVAVLAEDKEGNRSVCKLVNVSRAGTKEQNEARKEARLLAQLKHPYIVRYRENFNEKGWLCIVMDFCDGGDVAAAIEKAKSRKELLAEARIQRWITQSMLALKYLHDKHVLHRDLKPSNLFLTRENDLRIGDFGISKALEATGAFAKTFVGTPYYISPEVIGEKPYAWASDVWSMGCILYQLCSHQVPWDAKNIKELARKIQQAAIPKIPEGYSEDLRRLCTDMMRRNPNDRATVDVIVNTQLVQDVVKGLLAEKKNKAAASKPEATADIPAAPEVDADEKNKSVKHEIMDQFNRFDRNGDGVVDRMELSAVLKHLDKKVWTDARIDQVLEIADVNKDGQIQLDEFIRWIFGGANEVGQIEIVKQMIEMASKATKDGNLDVFGETMLRWRQAVDIGCLRVSDGEICAKTCEALASLGSELLVLGDESTPANVTFDICRHMVAILDCVARLLTECSHQHVARVAGVSSRVALRGLCFELGDGTRIGYSPGGLADAGLDACSATWEELQAGEFIVEVSGHSAAEPAQAAAAKAGAKRGVSPPRSKSKSPSPPPSARAVEDCLASSVLLTTNIGRQIALGGGVGKGEAFSFKVKAGREIEDATFAAKSCSGVQAAPFAVRWPQEKHQAIKQAFDAAVNAIGPVMLRLSARVGPVERNYALLQAWQLGFSRPESSDWRTETQEELMKIAETLETPKHWDTSAMPPDTLLIGSGAQVSLDDAELSVIQVLVNSSYAPKLRRDPSRAKLPSSLQLQKGFRVQSWRDWIAFSARGESIRADIKKTPIDVDDGHARLKTAGHHPLGLELDTDINCAWLFHHIDAKAAEKVSPADLLRVLAEERGNDLGRLYGRGVYFCESCNVADEQAAESAGGLRYMLLCRVTLGRVRHDDAILPDIADVVGQCLDGSHHSVVGDREKQWPESAHREFVVYDCDQIYPEFLFAYKRSYK